jgi:hypothetical protein
VHHDGTGSIATEDNRAWGLASYGPIAACGQLLYHIHTTRTSRHPFSLALLPYATRSALTRDERRAGPAEEQRQQQESSTMDLESAEPSQKQKRAQWLVDVYQTPGMQHVCRVALAMQPPPTHQYPLFRPAPQNASFKQPFEPTPVRPFPHRFAHLHLHFHHLPFSASSRTNTIIGVCVVCRVWCVQHPDKANGLGGMFEVITAMPRYQAFSFEELRWEATSHLRAPVDTTRTRTSLSYLSILSTWLA